MGVCAGISLYFYKDEKWVFFLKYFKLTFKSFGNGSSKVTWGALKLHHFNAIYTYSAADYDCQKSYFCFSILFCEDAVCVCVCIICI